MFCAPTNKDIVSTHGMFVLKSILGGIFSFLDSIMVKPTIMGIRSAEPILVIVFLHAAKSDHAYKSSYCFENSFPLT